MPKKEAKEDIEKNSKAQIDADVYRFPPSRSPNAKENQTSPLRPDKVTQKYLAKKSCKVDVVASQSTKQLQRHGHVLPHTPQHHHKEKSPEPER